MERNAYLIASFGEANQKLKRMQPFVTYLPMAWKPPLSLLYIFPPLLLVALPFQIKPMFILHILVDVSCLPKLYKTKLCSDHLGHMSSGLPEAVSQVHP